MNVRWLVLGTGLGMSSSAWAGIHIGGVAYTTLQAAVDAATLTDVVEIDAGTISEAGTVVVDHDVVIEGAGASSTTVTLTSGTPLAVFVVSGASLTLRDLEILGAGTAQRAIDAGAPGATLVIEDAAVDAARASASGGALYVVDPVAVTLSRVTFSVRALATPPSSGGAMYVSASSGAPDIALTDVTFVDAIASGNGGAIYASGVDLTCDGCAFDGPAGTAAASGGAIYATGSGSLTVRRSRFCGISAATGGAVHGGGPTATLVDDVFAENTGTSAGAAVSAAAGAWTIRNNHFLDNVGNAVQTGTTATVTASNNLFSGTTGYAIVLGALSGPVVGFNWLDGNGGSNAVSNYTGPWPGTNYTGAGAGAGDPDLVGWPGDCLTSDLWPTPYTSPLVDAGDDTLSDPDGTRSDIGAFGGPDADGTLPIWDDGDGDGFTYLQDCDDADGVNFPGSSEICDHHDNDCDGDVDDADADVTDQTLWYEDRDGDGQGSGSVVAIEACFEPTAAFDYIAGDDGYASLDCDDTDATVYFGADEYCAVGDQNCDGDPDLGAVDGITFYTDEDGDGYGDPYLGDTYCVVTAPPGTAPTGDDCNDANSAIHPGAADPCPDGIDQDCGGADGDPTNSDPWYVDDDGDGFGDQGAPAVYSCMDLPGYTAPDLALDCDDTNELVNPDAAEVCNGVDDDCDGGIDDAGPVVTWFPDGDGDGYGAPDFAIDDDCAPGDDWVTTGEDCDDDDDAVNPGAVERCNGVDDDCDEATPDCPSAETSNAGDGDGDGFAPPEDCDDADPSVHPGAEEDLGPIDRDCDGLSDPKAPFTAGCGCAGGAPSSAVGLALATLWTRRRRAAA